MMKMQYLPFLIICRYGVFVYEFGDNVNLYVVQTCFVNTIKMTIAPLTMTNYLTKNLIISIIFVFFVAA
ncbi:hypothetical protein ADJ77_03195 [Prevotella fusca JCM 17724]|uniref:Uncharacterized protein n=1 Tax=Prevotella fusca JCM 17724 TaxID=1236517 RepID=A0A0K1NIC6_9BACT|nr:hypothetical protein ADJ77_03195 [Prevotella fusca JCM 17724]